MRVFVTGASGYIGLAVTGALARAGHEVLGLVRSEEKADAIAPLEARPVVGSMGDPSSYREAARTSQVIIHCAVEYSRSQWELDRKTIDACLAAAGESGQQRLFVYTSGAWVYGDTGDGMADEGVQPRAPAFITPRVEHEKLVLDWRMRQQTRAAVRVTIGRWVRPPWSAWTVLSPR